MCGILGGNIKKWDWEKGIETIKHRGPDGKRVMHFDVCTLGFARLAIMDLSERAMQPFLSPDGNVAIVFNGEIYGFQKLKNVLKRKYDFRTTSDTEVILYAYMEYGDDFIELIDGMFAIAIYDRRIEQIKLYRDRYGIKPLYYFYKETQFAFSSELKGLIAACNNYNFEVDNTAIYDYLAYQYIPEPKSMYRDVYKLEPASCLFYDLRKHKIVRKGNYWHLHVNTKAHGKRKRQEVLDDIRELIKQSVSKQIIADVAVGTFLSGGVDSSIISYECNQLNPSIETFSIGFKEKIADESGYAKRVANFCNLNNKTKILSMNDVSMIKGILKKLYDEPFADTSAYPTYILSEFARKNVKVILTGDGGDELFGGYDRYKLFFERRQHKHINHMSLERVMIKLAGENQYLRKKLSDLFESELSTFSKYMGVFDEWKLDSWRKFLKIDKDYDVKWYLRKYYHEELPRMTRMRYLDFKTYLPSDILTKVDRTSMSVSLETRIPFLDRELVEYVFSLADDECYYDGELKTLLKYAYKDVFPEDILFRKKMGFSIPHHYIVQFGDSLHAAILKQEWKSVISDIRLKNR